MVVQNPCEGFMDAPGSNYETFARVKMSTPISLGATTYTKFTRSPGVNAYAILREARQNRSSNRSLRGETLLITGLWVSVSGYRYVLAVSYDRSVSYEF